jgi:hypothetical protein
MPPIRGIVQSAGVLDDAVLARQDRGRLARVLAPKVMGTQHLHELTLRDPNDLFVLYSSFASLAGSPGQANHAAANAFLDSFAAARRRQGRAALSVAWGPWGETGAAVRHGVVERGAARGLFAITPQEGLGALELALHGGAVHIGVAKVDWEALLADRRPVAPIFQGLLRGPRRGDGLAAGGEEPGARWIDEVRAAPPARRRAEVLRFVRAQVTRLLGLKAPDVATDRPLSEMGLDSLLAVEVRNVLGKAFGLALPATVTFDHPSIEALAGYLFERTFGEADGDPHEERRPARTTVIEEIETLPDDEVDRLIAERLLVR